jgi:hypothetical protein
VKAGKDALARLYCQLMAIRAETTYFDRARNVAPSRASPSKSSGSSATGKALLNGVSSFRVFLTAFVSSG